MATMLLLGNIFAVVVFDILLRFIFGNGIGSGLPFALFFFDGIYGLALIMVGPYFTGEDAQSTSIRTGAPMAGLIAWATGLLMAIVLLR